MRQVETLSETPQHHSVESVCEDAIRRFESAWLTGQRPAIVDYLNGSPTDQLQLLIELVHIDIELRYRQGEVPLVESYLEQFPALQECPEEIPGLITAEFMLRLRHGQPAKEIDFFSRFPEYREQLAGKLSSNSTTLSWRRRQPARLPAEFPSIPGYQINELLGYGGMGVVYRATQPSLQRAVAIKTLLSGISATDEVKARFRHEAEAIARLDHPHLVPVYEVGEWQPDGVAGLMPYFVMKFYPGGSLANEPSGPGTDLLAHVKIVETISEAVHHAHQRGILHRDLKPSNILLDEQGQPHVVDFGLAGRFDPQDPQSMTASVMGTPAYMAPEQARSPSQVTTAVDVYGLGAILYQLLTGRPPFSAETPLALLERVAYYEPPPPSQFNAHVPRDLETICLKCLEKEPGRRYESAAALAADLARYRTGQSILARPQATYEKAWRSIRRHPALSAMVLLTFTILTASVIILARNNYHIKEQELETREALAREKWTHAELLSTFNREQQLLYSKRIQSVGRMWTSNQLPQAWSELEQCPERYRGWEWRYFNGLRNREPVTIHTPERVMRGVSFLSEKQLMTCDSAGLLTIWDTGTGKEIKSWKGSEESARWLAVYPDRSLVAVCAENDITIWNYVTQTQIVKLRGCLWAAFSPDGKYLAASHSVSATRDSNDIIVWETANWKQKWLLQGHSNVSLGGTYTPDSKTLITTSSDRTIRRWNMEDGKAIGEPWKRALPTFRVACLAGGKYLAEAQPAAMLWSDMTSGKEVGRYNWSTVTQPRVLTGRVQVVTGPDPSLIGVSGPSHDILVWDVQRNKSVATFRGHTLHIGGLEISPGGKFLVSISHDLTIRIWTVGEQYEYRSVGEVRPVIYDIAVSPEGDTAVVIPNFHAVQTARDQIRVLQLNDGTEASRYSGVGAACYTKDGHLIAAAGDEQGVTCWNLKTREKVWHHDTSEVRCSHLRLRVDGKMVYAVLMNGIIQQLDATSGELVKEFNVNDRFMGNACISPQGHRLTFVSHREVEVWDIPEQKKVGSFQMNGTRKIVYSPDGSVMATAEADRVIRLRNSHDGSVILSFPGHPRTIQSMAFSGDGKRLVSSCADGLIRIWDVETGQELTVLPGQFEESVLVTWDTAKDRIVAVDTKIHIWELHKEGISSRK